MVTYGAVAATKVRVPRPDQSALTRPRLLQTLDPVLKPTTRLMLVTAGTGYGKTTLAAQWAASRQQSTSLLVAWLTIDPSDDQPTRFWSLVIAALERAVPALQGDKLHQTALPQSSGDNAFIDSIITRIADHREPIVLIVDDCHLLGNRGVLQDLDYLVLRAPQNLKFLLLGRSLPQLGALYQVNLDGALVEVASESLAFTRREMVQMVIGSPLDADRLLDLTEGWPAAIKLANRYARSIRLHQTPDILSDPLHIQLLRPLFESYGPELQELLLIASTLKTWTVEDLNHALGRGDGSLMLERLQAETGMVVEVGSVPPSAKLYRLHRLLQRFLAAHAAANPTDLLAGAHARMAAWLPGRKRHAEALAHAAQAADAAILKTTLAASGLELLWQGDTAQILELSGRPDSQSFAELTLLNAAIALKAGDPGVAAKSLDHLKRTGGDERLPTAFRALATGLHAQVLMSQGSYGEAVELTKSAAGQLPRDDLDLYLANILAAALVGVGRLEDALSVSVKVTQLAHDRGNLPALVDARSVAAAVYAAREDFGMARTEATWAIRRGGESDLRYSPSLRPAHLIAAWCAYQALDDTSALVHNAYVRRSESAAPVIAHSNSKLSLILEFLGGTHRHDAAAGLLDRVRFDLIHGSFPQDLAICSLQTASMLLQLRHGDALEKLKSELRQHQGVSGELHTISAWELLAAGHLGSARKLLSAVTAGYVESQSRCTIHTAWALTCRIELEEERPYQARVALGEALRLGAESGSLRAFAFAGSEVRAAVAREQQYFPAFSHVIARITSFRGGAQSAFCPPLTHRELDLLALLPTFATVDEIAERLLISTNTVKTHVRGIYRKLGATSRREAIAIAQDLGLLPVMASTAVGTPSLFDGALPPLTHHSGS